jgi:hypothetical protein
VACVDNVVILGRRLQDVKNKIFTSLVQQTNKMGLEINKKKTKFDLSRKSYNENKHLTFGTCNLKY